MSPKITAIIFVAVAAAIASLGPHAGVAQAQERQAGAAPLDATPTTRLSEELRCRLGVYSMTGGRYLTITGDGGHPRNLHYTLSGRRFGSLQAQADGGYGNDALAVSFAPCGVGSVSVKYNGAVETGRRVRLDERTVTFESDGISLHGKLVAPSGRQAQALAVWIEGSNNNPSTDDTVWQYELARRGVAVFVYDKRGTGASRGAQTSDFFARARDTAAAVKVAQRLAPGIRRIGVIGGSQGGWVAPLTATLTPLEFVIPAFALADGPIAQDKALVELQLQEAGFDERALADARELTAITERIVRADMATGFEELEAFKAKHAASAWLQAIQPRSYTGLFVRFSTAEIKAIGPAAAQGLSFTYEPRPTIETIKARQLWLLGGADKQAPNAASQRILREVQQTKPNVSVVVFSQADHGLVERIESANGAEMTYASGVFDITATWIKNGRLPQRGRFLVLDSAR